ncbi:MAG: hypothetical protein HFI72_07705 [Peptococcaceae bacterium]|jgi:hypothetical protein|nr:hypothetical protein [Peptococcaceae bacterium]
MELFEMIIGNLSFLLLGIWLFLLPDETVVEKTGLSAKVIFPGLFCLIVGDWTSVPLDIGNSQIHVKVGSIAAPILLGCFFLFSLRDGALRWRSFFVLGAEFILLLFGDSFFAGQITWNETYLFWGLLVFTTGMTALLLQDYGAFCGVHLIALPLVFVVQGLWRAKITSIVHIGGGAVFGMLGISSLLGIGLIYLLQQHERRHFTEQVLSADK